MPETAPLRVILAKPRGFCAGVVRAIDIVERALSFYGPPVYVRHEIVHNLQVIERLRAHGAIFVRDTDEVPEGAVTVFSAHGVSRAVEERASAQKLDVIDATCPLVRKVHREGQRYAQAGYDVVLIGHDGHPEVEGTKGQIDGRLHVLSTVAEVSWLRVADPEKVAYVTQTTLSVSDTKDVIAALIRRFPTIVGPDTRDICYATQNRQSAVLRLVGQVQLLLVAGSANSSNSNRLREVGESHGVRSHLVQRAEDVDPAWLVGVEAAGLTAGASAPEDLLLEIIGRLADTRRVSVEALTGPEESITFRLPERLAGSLASKRASWHVNTMRPESEAVEPG